MFIFIVNKNGTPLMPTNDWPRIRKYLKEGKAKIFCHRPFTVQLLYLEGGDTQPIELSMDTGYENIGVSVKSQKHEYVSEERKLLTGEKKHHQKQVRIRRARRNRLKYRKPQPKRVKCSRKKEKGRLAPSIKNKADRHVDIIKLYKHVCPLTSVTLEMGQFDTHVLSAVSQGLPAPEGIGYQHGPAYGFDTLREAVFARDKYTCKCCKKSAIKDGVILVTHHIGYRTGDRSNRISNLATVCTKCHAAKNHQKGGKLYNLKPASSSLPGAASMNSAKWYIYNHVCNEFADDHVHITYGAVTKRERLSRNIRKSHANDAYCIGQFHPGHRCRTRYYRKCRRNDRCPEKFYDATYISERTGKREKGAALGCNRTNRSIPRKNPRNLRILHGFKKKGKRSIRKMRYPFKSGCKVLYKGKTYMCGGQHNKGKSVVLKQFHLSGKDKSVRAEDVKIIRYVNGWLEVTREQF